MIVRLVSVAVLVFGLSDRANAVVAECAETGSELLITFRSPNGPSKDIVFHVDREGGTKTCAGDVFFYVNGEPGMVGPITINRIEPDQQGCVPGAGCLHGWQINQCNGNDCPVSTPRHAQCIASGGNVQAGYDGAVCGGVLPKVVSSGSVIKARDARSSTGQVCSDNCIQGIAVLSVTSSAPLDPSDTFRPPFYGITKPAQWFTWSGLDLSGWSRLDCSSLSGTAPTFEAVRDRFQNTMYHYPHFEDRHFRPIDVVGPAGGAYDHYHGGSSITNAGAVLRMQCDDFDPLGNPIHKAAVVGYLQYGLDLAWWFRGRSLAGRTWPSNSMGNKIPAAVFARVSHDADITAGAQSSITNEERFYYVSNNTTAPYGGGLWGREGTESNYWSNGSDGYGTTKTQWRDPYGYVDAQSSYAKCCSFGAGPGLHALAVLLTDSRSEYDAEGVMSFGYRMWKVGMWWKPDPCLDKAQGGGPDGAGGCIRDSGGNNPRHEGDFHAPVPVGVPDPYGYWGGVFKKYEVFLESFEDAFFDCAWNASCVGGHVGIRGAPPRPAAPFLLED